MPGAFEGETVTRRGLMTGGALGVGGVATLAFALPALGFALGPNFTRTEPHRWQDIGARDDFNNEFYTPDDHRPGRERRRQRQDHDLRPQVQPAQIDGHTTDQPYVAISNRCMHLGCPVRYVQAAQRFICPCHGGVYGQLGQVDGGPPVRPLDRFYTRVNNGRVEVGPRYSLDSHFKRFPHPRDPSNHLDGLWQYLYPARPTT